MVFDRSCYECFRSATSTSKSKIVKAGGFSKIIKWLAGATTMLCLHGGVAQTTYMFTSGMPDADATIRKDLGYGSVPGAPPSTYVFAAGNYVPAMTPWILPCVNGNVFTGPAASFAPGTGIAPMAIIAPTFTDNNALKITGDDTYTTPGAGCTVQFLAARNQNFYIQAPVSGLLFQFNSSTGIYGEVLGGTDTTSYAGIYIGWDANGNSTTQDIGYSRIQHNTFGPSCTDIDGLSTDKFGTCGGIIVQGSNVNLTVQDNNSYGQIEEFFHTLGQSSSGNRNGSISTNLLVQNNDMAQVHRIPIETQQETVTNQVVQYNDAHDYYNPFYITQGISNACCLPPSSPPGDSTSPVPTTYDNVIIQNTSCAYASTSYCLGYGIEAWGDGGTFDNNLIQNNAKGYATIAVGAFVPLDWVSTTTYKTGQFVQYASTDYESRTNGNLGNSPPTDSTDWMAVVITSDGMEVKNNTIQSTSSLLDGVVCEDGGTVPSCDNVTFVTYSPNTTSSTISAVTSARPVMNANYVTIGSVPVIPSSCTFYIGTLGTSGRYIVCGVVKAPTPVTEAATPDCYGVYAEPAPAVVNAFVTVSLSGCPVESAGANLWVFENTNDSATTLGISSCGTTGCGSSYVSQTWNDYNGFPSSFNGQRNWNLTNFISYGPPLVTLLNEVPGSQLIAGNW